MLFGDKLKDVRKRKGLSQDEMSSLLFMSQSNYSKYETNKKKPSIDLLQLVSKEFDIPIQELLQIENVPTTNKNSISNTEKEYALSKKMMNSFLGQLENTSILMMNVVKRLKQLQKK